jgi:hypothetical protein
MDERRKIPVTLDQLKLLEEAMQIYYLKGIRKAQRTNPVRGKKDAEWLRQLQECFQLVAFYKNAWEHDSWPESS